MTTARKDHQGGDTELAVNIVEVGVDEAGPIAQAVFWAAGEAHRRGAALSLVHGYTLPIAGMDGEVVYPSQIFDADRVRMTKMLESVAATLTTDYPGLKVQWSLQYGAAVDVMVRGSDRASLAVVGVAVGHHWLRSIVGSVASEMVQHQGCPVIIVRPDPVSGVVRYDGPVVVAIEGANEGHDILQFAFEEAALRGAALVALHVKNPDTSASPEGTESLAIAFAAAAAEHPETETRFVVIHGDPIKSILEYCRPPQSCVLLVAGGRSHHQLVSMIFGSTTSALIDGLSCPLAILPRG